MNFLATPSALRALTSPTKDWTQAPAVKVPSPKPWTARKFPNDFYYKEKLFPFPRALKKKVVNIYNSGVYKKQDTSGLHKKDFIGSGGTSSKWSLITEQMNKPKRIYSKRLTGSLSFNPLWERKKRYFNSAITFWPKSQLISWVTVIKYILLILNT